jgi:hypothetical protein
MSEKRLRDTRSSCSFPSVIPLFRLHTTILLYYRGQTFCSLGGYLALSAASSELACPGQVCRIRQSEGTTSGGGMPIREAFLPT